LLDEENIAELYLWIDNKICEGWHKVVAKRQNNTSKHAARVLDRNFDGEILFTLPFFKLSHCEERKRARDAQEASEGSARPIVPDQDFRGATKGKGLGWFSGWLLLAKP